MKALRGSVSPKRKFHVVAMALFIAIAVVALLAPTGRAESEDLAPFPHPAGIVSTPSRLLAVSTDAPNVIVAIDRSGVPSTFATLDPRPPGNDFPSLAVSPGLGGFSRGEIFVTQDRDVFRISRDGRDISLFTRIPGSCPSGQVSIAFDEVGTFGYSMLFVDSCSGIWRKGLNTDIQSIPYEFVAPPGMDRTERKLAHSYVSRIEVAPATFAPFGGNLIIPVPDPHHVFGMEPLCEPGGWDCREPGGEFRPKVRTLRPAQGTPGHEEQLAAYNVNFVPHEICTFENDGAFYASSHTRVGPGPNKILRLNRNATNDVRLRDSRGVALLTGGGHGYARTNPSPSPTTNPVEELRRGQTPNLPPTPNPSPTPDPQINDYIGLLRTDGATVTLERWYSEPERDRWNELTGADFAACPEPFSVTADALRVAEGNAGTKTIRVQVTRAGPEDEALELAYSTADGTATSPADYIPTSSTSSEPLRFEAGETRKEVPVTVVGDPLEEPDETFLLKLARASDPSVVLAQAIITIVDDDSVLNPGPLPQLAPLPPPGETPRFLPHTPPKPPPVNPPPVTHAVNGQQGLGLPGPQAPPPAPPGSAPAVSSQPGPASFSAAQSSAAGVVSDGAPVLAGVPAPPVLSPQFQPLAHPMAGNDRQQDPQAAPEADHAMVAHEPYPPSTFTWPAGGLAILALACFSLGLRDRGTSGPVVSLAGAASLASTGERAERRI